MRPNGKSHQEVCGAAITRYLGKWDGKFPIMLNFATRKKIKPEINRNIIKDFDEIPFQSNSKSYYFLKNL